MQEYETKIQQLIEKMTTEEKIGQLRQVGPSIVGAFEVSFEEMLDMLFDGVITQEEFDKKMGSSSQDYRENEIREGKIGSFNGVGDARTSNRLQRISVEESRLGIPLLFGFDVIHGYRTAMPIPLGESCSWDEDLWERTARKAAEEAAAGGIHMTFAPMVDVARDARWGRICECAGEDVLLNCRFGSAKVRGFQGDDLTSGKNIAACVKHFAAYGAVEAGKDYNRVDMSLQKLYEEYLPPYHACVKAGARAVMPAFNDINGVPCSVNKKLLRGILRDEWKFDGMTISDSNAIAECVTHGICEDRESAAEMALNAGMDMDMASEVYHENLFKLIQNGKLDEKLLDQAVGNVLRIKYELGLFENPYKGNEIEEERLSQDPESKKLAEEAAEKSIVLLKNEGILPLSASVKLGVVGRLADRTPEMVGAWSVGADIKRCICITDVCRQRNIDFKYCEGIADGQVDEESIANLAKSCDVVIVAAGEEKTESGEAASKADITLPKIQIDMMECVLKYNKNAVLVLFNGRPMAIPWAAENMPAILEAWHPGSEAGTAILSILYGEVNPSGKLTTTFPYLSGQCPVYYSNIQTGRPGGRSKFTSKYIDTPIDPVYPFGYGLSYTSYEYSNVFAVCDGDTVRVYADIQNTGNRVGEEIVQCYLCGRTADRVRPVKELKGFCRVKLTAGETKTVEINIPVNMLGYYDTEMKYRVESGVYEFFVGTNSVTGLTCKTDILKEG